MGTVVGTVILSSNLYTCSMIECPQLLQQCWKLTFSVGSKYVLPGIKGGSKTNIPSSNYGWPCNSPVTTHYQIYDQTKFHMVKGIDSAFDHVELCFILLTEELL